MKRALVTGASGFIGRHCLAKLQARGFEVHAVSTRETSLHGVQWHRADLLQPAESARLLRDVQPSHLLHLAWYAEPGKFWRAPENYLWVEASLRLLRSFCEAGGQRAVLAGSCAEYDWAYGYCTESVTPLRPATVYGVCKNALRELTESLCAQHGVSHAWGRVFFLYGPGEPAAKLVSSVIRALLAGEPAACSAGMQWRDFLYVADVAEAFAALLDGTGEGAFNIASGAPMELMRLVQRIGELLGRPDLIKLGELPIPDGEPPLLAGNPARLSAEVHWRPHVDLQQGLQESISWWRRELNAQR